MKIRYRTLKEAAKVWAQHVSHKENAEGLICDQDGSPICESWAEYGLILLQQEVIIKWRFKGGKRSAFCIQPDIQPGDDVVLYRPYTIDRAIPLLLSRGTVREVLKSAICSLFAIEFSNYPNICDFSLLKVGMWIPSTTPPPA